MLQTEGDDVYPALSESYSDEELQSHSDGLTEGASVEGILYFEVPAEAHVTHAVFDCSLEEDGTGLWLRWKL